MLGRNSEGKDGRPIGMMRSPAVMILLLLLAGALAHHTHRATCGEWIGGVIKKTAIPFVLVLALSVTMGWWAQHICPSALRLTDALHCVKRQ